MAKFDIPPGREFPGIRFTSSPAGAGFCLGSPEDPFEPESVAAEYGNPPLPNCAGEPVWSARKIRPLQKAPGGYVLTDGFLLFRTFYFAAPAVFPCFRSRQIRCRPHRKEPRLCMAAVAGLRIHAAGKSHSGLRGGISRYFLLFLCRRAVPAGNWVDIVNAPAHMGCRFRSLQLFRNAESKRDGGSQSPGG